MYSYIINYNTIPIIVIEYLADVYWCKLMPLHKWYAFYPKLGHQRPSFSDIEQSFSDYNGV